MSDGDNATPGSVGPSSGDPDNKWLTRSQRPSPGAAPWERKTSPDSGTPGYETETERAGNHTDGVTVADLIARVSGDTAVPREPRRRRAAPDEPPAAHTEIIAAVSAPDEDYDAYDAHRCED